MWPLCRFEFVIVGHAVTVGMGSEPLRPNSRGRSEGMARAYMYTVAVLGEHFQLKAY